MGTSLHYNFPGTCSLNRLRVPAMVLKSNRSGLLMVSESNWSGLWCHIIGTQIMSGNMIKLHLSWYFCRATRILCHVGVTSCCNIHTCIFSFDYLCSVTTYDTIFFAAVYRYIIKHLIYETPWSILCWSHVTCLVKVHREYSPVVRIYHTKFD